MMNYFSLHLKLDYDFTSNTLHNKSHLMLRQEEIKLPVHLQFAQILQHSADLKNDTIIDQSNL